MRGAGAMPRSGRVRVFARRRLAFDWERARVGWRLGGFLSVGIGTSFGRRCARYSGGKWRGGGWDMAELIDTGCNVIYRASPAHKSVQRGGITGKSDGWTECLVGRYSSGRMGEEIGILERTVVLAVRSCSRSADGLFRRNRSKLVELCPLSRALSRALSLVGQLQPTVRYCIIPPALPAPARCYIQIVRLPA